MGKLAVCQVIRGTSDDDSTGRMERKGDLVGEARGVGMRGIPDDGGSDPTGPAC